MRYQHRRRRGNPFINEQDIQIDRWEAERLRGLRGRRAGVLGDYIRGPRSRAVLKDALTIPVWSHDYGYAPIGGAYISRAEGGPLIRLNYRTGDADPIWIAKVIFHEAAHALRDLRGRSLDYPAGMQYVEEYLEVPFEKSARRMGEYAGHIRKIGGNPEIDVKSPGYKAALDGLREYQGKSDWGYAHSIFTQPFERDLLLSGEVDAREVLRLVHASEKADGKKGTIGTVHMAFGMVYQQNLPASYLDASRKYLDDVRREHAATEARFVGRKKLLKREQRTIEFTRDRVVRAEHQVADAEKLLERWKEEPLPNPAPAGLYSALERVVMEKFPNRFSVEQARGILRGSPVKKDELEWSGFDKWLGEQTGLITKADALDAVQKGQTQIQEVVKGGRTQSVLEETEKNFRALLRENGMSENQARELALDVARGDPDATRLLLPRLRQAGAELQDAYQHRSADVVPTKYSTYALPGGEDYRELLLTLPARSPTTKIPTEWRVDPPSGRQQLYRVFDTNGDLLAYGESRDLALRQALEDTKKTTEPAAFRGAHWSEPNVLAHVRFNTRMGLDGKKILFIEEVQSDWHQKGRKFGYGKITELPADWKIEPIGDSSGRFYVDDPERYLGRITYATAEEAKVAALGILNEGSVPAAPFVRTWPDLVLKRMLQWAAQHDYDRVAWTTGAQQVARYEDATRGLVDKIVWNKAPDGIVQIQAFKDNTMVHGQLYSPDKVAELIGKDMASKIAASDQVTGEFTGSDLTIGGEGMKAFYDMMLPEAASKLVKRWGGKVGKTEISPMNIIAEGKRFMGMSPSGELLGVGYTHEEVVANARKHGHPPAIVHAIDLSPDLRKAVVQEGFPLFNPVGVGNVRARMRLPRQSQQGFLVKLWKQVFA